MRLRFDTIPVSKQRYRRLSAPAQRNMVQAIQRVMAPLPLRKTPLVRTERNLERLEKLIPKIASDPAVTGEGNVSVNRSAVVRMALSRGLYALETQYPDKRKR